MANSHDCWVPCWLLLNFSGINAYSLPKKKRRKKTCPATNSPNITICTPQRFRVRLNKFADTVWLRALARLTRSRTDLCSSGPANFKSVSFAGISTSQVAVLGLSTENGRDGDVECILECSWTSYFSSWEVGRREMAWPGSYCTGNKVVPLIVLTDHRIYSVKPWKFLWRAEERRFWCKSMLRYPSEDSSTALWPIQFLTRSNCHENQHRGWSLVLEG